MPIDKRKRQNGHEKSDKRVNTEVEVVANKEDSTLNGVFERSGLDLARSLRSGSHDVIREALLYLRRSTALSSYNERPAASDKRIQLAVQFLEEDIGPEGSSGSNSLLQIWTNFEAQNQSLLLPLPLFALSNLISLLGVHQPNHYYIDRLISGILPAQRSTDDSSTHVVSQFWSRLQMHLSNVSGKRAMQGTTSSQSSEVIIMATVRLLYEMTNFAGGKYSKVIFDNMNWTMKSIPRLLNMRRRTKGSKGSHKASTKDKAAVTLDRPDIRTLWILFLLSFLRLKSGIPQPASLQLSALSLGKDALPAILKGLINDSSQVVVFVLTTLHEALLSAEAASRLPRSKVAGFFSEWACKELLGLYDRQADFINIAGSTQERHSIADVIHHFMLALCTHPGQGICYVDQGWYGRTISDEKDDDETEASTFAVYNKILFGLLKSLTPTRSTKQAELSLRILESSQELIAPYFDQQLGLFSSSSLEPRGVAIGWLSIAAFLGRVLSIPLPKVTHWKQDPPSIERCLKSLYPTNLSRGILQRGIQHKDEITRHGALILLSRLLMRLLAFKTLCHDMMAQQVDNVAKQRSSTWYDVWEVIKDEINLCIPEMSTLLTSLQQKHAAKTFKSAEISNIAAKQTSSLIIEATLRAAKLHYGVFADATTNEISFLLSDVLPSSESCQEDDGSNEEKEGLTQMTSLCHMHAIQLLTSVAKINPGGLDLIAAQGSKSITPLRSLLNLARNAALDEVQAASWDLIAASMNDTILFEHDQGEWNIWRYALQHSSEEMLDLFDECAQRCLKTPYRYLEMGKEEWSKMEMSDVCISPLFYAIQEQYFIRLQNGLFTAQKRRLAFPFFLGYFMPALHALHREEVALSQTTPCMTVFDLTLQRLQEASSKSCDLQSQSNERGDKHWADKEETKAIEKAFRRAYDTLQCLVNGADDDSTAQEIESTLQIEMLHPDDGHLSLPLLKSYDDKDWKNLLLSPTETEILLIHCRNGMIKESKSCDQVRGQLQFILLHGHPASLASLSTILVCKGVLSRCIRDVQLTLTLVNLLIEAPIDLNNQMAKESLSTSLLSAAVTLAYDPTVVEKKEEKEESTRLLRISLISLYRYLCEEEQIQIWDKESDVDLLYNISLQLPKHLQWVNENRWLYLFNCLASSGVLKHLEKGLLLIQELNKDFSFSARPNLIAAQASMIERIITHPDARVLDTLLKSLLSESHEARQCILQYLEGKKGDWGNLLAQLPLSMTVLISHLPAGSNGLSKYKEILQELTKSNIVHLFDEDEKITIPFAYFCSLAIRQSNINIDTLNDMLISQSPTKPAQMFKKSILLLAIDLCDGNNPTWSSGTFMTSLVDMSLLWLVRRFAEDLVEDEETTRGVEAFLILLHRIPQRQLKSHLVEPVISAAVLNPSGSLLHLRLIDTLLHMTPMKRTFVEKVLLDLMENKESISNKDKRAQVVDMVYKAVQKDPFLCELDLIVSTIKLYEGSLMISDRKVLLILQQYEFKSRASVMTLLQEHWKVSSASEVNQINLGILSRLDYLRLHETSLKYPRHRGFDDMMASGYTKEIDCKEVKEAVYDPLLILSIVGELTTREAHLSGLQWIELIRSNALGVLICTLSSKMVSTRKMAKMILARIYKAIQLVHFQEKNHLLLILDYARNSYSEKAEDQEEEKSLPLTITLFIAFCLRSLGAPSLYLYPLVSRFLLQRPLPDPTDIPLLYNFLYSSSTQSTTFKAEKTFILRYIFICIKYGGKMEWNIIKRRHVWDSICTMYASDNTDASCKHIIEDIFLAVSCKRDVAFRVIIRHGFLQYFQQLLIQQSKDTKEHTKHFILQCMANLLENLDLDRLERALGASYLVPFTSLLTDCEILSIEIKDVKLLRDVLTCLKGLHQRGIHLDLVNVRKSVNMLSAGMSNDVGGSMRSDQELMMLQNISFWEELESPRTITTGSSQSSHGLESHSIASEVIQMQDN